MQLCDMHIHVKDGIYNSDKLNKIIDKGINECITTFLFLDHGDRISQKKHAVLKKENIPIFFSNVDKVKRDGINIYKGIEVDFSYDAVFRNEVIDMIENNDFDYVVGSIHSMNDLSEELYYQAVIDMLNIYPIDIVAHIRMNNHYMNHVDRFRTMMDICHRKNIMIEINTSSRSLWNKDQLEFMYNLMEEYDVEYTIGSDAHEIDQIAENFNYIKNYFKKGKYFLHE